MTALYVLGPFVMLGIVCEVTDGLVVDAQGDGGTVMHAELCEQPAHVHCFLGEV